MKDSVRLLICGDIMPRDNNIDAFVAADIDRLFGNTIDLFKSADFRFCNFEGVLSDRGVAIDKAGPNLRATPAAAKTLKAMNFDLVGLSNNHSLDWGKEGLTDTFTTLRSLGIPFTGAGYNAEAARKPYRVEVCGRKISFITVAEHEFTIANAKRAGANPFDPYDTIEDIEAEKKAGYIVIVIYHGGKEQYRYTSPNTRRRCRKMAEHGADFIFCQHTHCVSCFEEYAGCHICYGQGNTLFTSRDASNEYWRTLVLPMITLNANGTDRVDYTPVTVVDNTGLMLAEGDDAAEIMNGFTERSVEILDDEKLMAHWKDFFITDGVGRLKSMGMINQDGSLPNERRLTTISNYITAEIHYESVTSAVEYLRHENFGNLLVDGEE